jgi:hypothetical protein
MKSRTDNDEPQVTWLKMLKLLPRRATPRMEKVLPKSMKSKTDTESPNRANARKLKLEPQAILSRTDMQDPKRDAPRTLIEEPNRLKLRTDNVLPTCL